MLYLTFVGLVSYTKLTTRTALMIILIPLTIMLVSIAVLVLLLGALIPHIHMA